MRSLWNFAVLALAVVFSPLPATAGESLSYNRDVRPILSENCFFCHGFDADNRKADLRLDTFAGAVADLGGYAAIVPGDPDRSELVIRIESEDTDEQMPPHDSVYELDQSQRKTLRRWIADGAEYEEHWAYRPLERSEVSEASPVDTFIERRWIEEGVEPADRATPRDLVRRLSFDLRGIPPSASDVAAFEDDPSDSAYEALVDRWMASLEYAEHQAVGWLDLVRWADSSGMVSDEPIASGAYRRYVIESIHENQPFDVFTVEQLAGDLVPEPDDRTLTASGYNRIVKTNSEAGVIDKEALYALKGEHVRALGTVWLGATTGCAECHDHKYDPITQADYYNLAAFFDDLAETGVYTPGDRRQPLHYVHDNAADRQRDAELSAEVARLSQPDPARPDPTEMATWVGTVKADLADSGARSVFPWIPAQLPGARVVEGDFTIGERSGRAARLTTVAGGELNRHLAAELMTGFFKHGSYSKDKEAAYVVDVFLDPDDPPSAIALTLARGDYGRIGWEPDNFDTFYWGDDEKGAFASASPTGSEKRTERLGDLPEPGAWVTLRIPMSKTLGPAKFFTVGMAWMHVGGSAAWGDCGLDLTMADATKLAVSETVVRKWWETPFTRGTYQERMTLVPGALSAAADRRSTLQNELVASLYLERSQPDRLDRLRAAESALGRIRGPAVPVLVSRAGAPKETRLLPRGNFMDESGPISLPAVPSNFGKLDTAGRRANRLDLASWLVSGANPIVPRVFANRAWEDFFGRGISETLEDSGGQGDWPSHPDLLDWLAAEFRDSGWDRKHLVRLLVTTDAYKLSSRPTDRLAALDPGNRWHARQARFRVPAEAVRDSALAVAGLLQPTETIPVASFFPFQPAAYWEKSSKVMFGSRHQAWDTARGSAQHQRSLYTYWKRQNVQPTMLAFDAPTRQECTARRGTTNTPGQALALLNDPIFFEAAEGLAERIESSADSTGARAHFVFKTVLQRPPTPEETAVVTRLAETDGWLAVARTMLNLHEFLTRP